jgi:hypothetical protein
VGVEYPGRVERGPQAGEERAFGVRAHQRQPAGLERADAVLGGIEPPRDATNEKTASS